MRGRYSLADFNNRFANRFKVANYIGELQPRFNVASEQAMPVVVRKVERGRQLRFADGMQWGLIPSWTKDLSKAPRPINARAETVGELPSFRGPFRQKRCLVPASSFFEWKQTGQGVPVHPRALSDVSDVLAAPWRRTPAPSVAAYRDPAAVPPLRTADGDASARSV
jgi:putative SOS response-associated peptidase YedK